MKSPKPVVVWLAAGLLVLLGCGDDNPFAPDVTAPAAVADLRVVGSWPDSMRLAWTAPGDDGATGTASQCDIRYSTSGAITEATWNAATQVAGEPAPAAGGSPESFTMIGRDSSATYWFALRTADEVPNWSTASNSPGEPPLDTIAPAAVTDLRVVGSWPDSMRLAWAAPGDDGATGTASQYDIRYSPSGEITEANWSNAARATSQRAPLVSGSADSFTVTGLVQYGTYWFALKTGDGVPNWAAVSNSPSGTCRVPDFFLVDENPNSATAGQQVSPRHRLGDISGWYFGHST